MQLEQQEIINLYEGVIKPFEHPDPMGYLARAFILSEFDPEFADLEGRRGFMPIETERATEATGVSNVASLQDNIIATLTMDRQLIEKYGGDVDRAMIEMRFGEAAVPFEGDSFGEREQEFIDDVNEIRIQMKDIIYPSLATVKDVIQLLDEGQVDERLDNQTKKFIAKLLEL